MSTDDRSGVVEEPVVERLDEAMAEAFPPTLAGRVSARVVARLRPRYLNRKLIAGVDPSTCAWLAARARRLTSAPYRAYLAAALRLIIDVPGAPSRRSRIRPRARAIRANVTELRDMADVLTGAGPVYARGLAMLDELLSDGAGPVYVDRSGSALAEALAATRAALSGG